MRWMPALTDSPEVDALAAAMPAPVTALGGGDGRSVTTAVVAAVVETIVAESVERMELPASPPHANTPTDLNDTIIARMDGSMFRANANLASDTARRLEQWSRGVTATNRKKLVVELDPPGERWRVGGVGEGARPARDG